MKSGHISPDIFVKSPRTNDVSVFRIAKCAETTIWELAEQYVDSAERKVKGRADLFATTVYEQELGLVSSPPPRHANIVNWASDKAIDKMKRVELARKAKLLTRP